MQVGGHHHRRAKSLDKGPHTLTWSKLKVPRGSHAQSAASTFLSTLGVIYSTHPTISEQDAKHRPLIVLTALTLAPVFCTKQSGVWYIELGTDLGTLAS